MHTESNAIKFESILYKVTSSNSKLYFHNFPHNVVEKVHRQQRSIFQLQQHAA
jgi:hypothetical protein